MANFYISDIHEGHKNIIQYDKRPFFTISEMNKTLIDNWNKKVSENDTVYILGDLSWSKNGVEFYQSLKGNKVLIKGNHDTSKFCRDLKENNIVKMATDYMEISDCQEKIILSHYFIPFWNGQFKNTIHLYGHVHNSSQWILTEQILKDLRQKQNIPLRAYNVGCMMPWMNYEPKTLSEIIDGYNKWQRNFNYNCSVNNNKHETIS